jgi:hypothetical protein
MFVKRARSGADVSYQFAVDHQGRRPHRRLEAQRNLERRSHLATRLPAVVRLGPHEHLDGGTVLPEHRAQVVARRRRLPPDDDLGGREFDIDDLDCDGVDRRDLGVRNGWAGHVALAAAGSHDQHQGNENAPHGQVRNRIVRGYRYISPSDDLMPATITRTNQAMKTNGNASNPISKMTEMPATIA